MDLEAQRPFVNYNRRGNRRSAALFGGIPALAINGAQLAFQAANYMAGNRRRSNSDLAVPSYRRPNAQIRGRVLNRLRANRARTPSRSVSRVRSSYSRSASMGGSGGGSVGGNRGRPSGFVPSIRRMRRVRFQRRRRRVGNRNRRGLNPVKDGAETVTETSGVISTQSPNAVYVGHGAATTTFWNNVCRAIVRKLARGAGIEIVDWGHNVDGATSATNMKLQIQYSTTQSTTVWAVDDTNIIIPALPSLFTWAQLALQLSTRLDTIFSSSDSNPNIGMILIYQNDAQTLPLMKLDCTRMKVHYKISSKLKLQNTSLAINGLDTQDESMDNVGHNPLTGKLYYSRYRANGFKLETHPINGVGPVWSTMVPNVAGYNTGSLTFKVDTADSADFKAKFKKPPSGHMFSLIGKPYGISPGQIKQLNWFDKRTIQLNQLISIYQKSLTDQSAFNYQNIGRFQMVGLEKKMHCSSSEANIQLDWALEQYYSCVVTSYKGSVPKLQIIVDP